MTVGGVSHIRLKAETKRSHQLRTVTVELGRLKVNFIKGIEVTLLHLVLICQIYVSAFIAIAQSKTEAVNVSPIGVICLCSRSV